jgi:hypothetical protein
VPGVCSYLITFLSIVLLLLTLPFSLVFAIRVVQVITRIFAKGTFDRSSHIIYSDIME